MNNRKDISTMNCRILIRQWGIEQDFAYGPYTVLLNEWTVWANKRNRAGTQVNQEAQQQWLYDTTFMIRYDARIKSNFTIDHDGQRWVINSIEKDSEGYKGMMLLRASTTDVDVS